MLITARSVIRAALAWALRTIITGPAFTWGRIHLMGEHEVLGQFSDPHAPTFHVRVLQGDGTWSEHVYGRGALYGVDKLDEADVRREVATKSARNAWNAGACARFRSSAVWPEFCADCATTARDHVERARERDAEAARRRLVKLTKEKIAGITGDSAGNVDLHDEEGDNWTGEGSIASVVVWPTGGGRRDLTPEEISRARADGVPLAEPKPEAPVDEEPESAPW